MKFADLPIRRKILTLALVTAGSVLLATCAVLVTYDLITFRRELTRQMTTLTEVVAANSSAALAFDSRSDANELLANLAAEKSIMAAGLYNADGALFAHYARVGAPPASMDKSIRAGAIIAGGQAVFYQPVFEDGQRVGTLYIESDLHPWYARFWLYAVVVLVACGIALLLAMVLSTVLRKRITDPIDELAAAARNISERRNYSIRARRHSNDELGQLTDVFNHMLAQIQDRDEKLGESEERLRMALLAADMGTWRYDPQSGLDTRDASLNRLMGLDPVMTTQPIEDSVKRILPEDWTQVKTVIDRTLADHGDYALEYRITRPDASVRWIRIRGRALPGLNGKYYLTGAAFDITDRKASEEEIQRLNADLEKRVALRTAELAETNEDLEAFTYSVSHDLRAPLRIVSGYAELLLEDHGKALPADGLEYAQRIVRGAGRMSRLIDDLLRLCRLGRQPLTLQLTDLNRVVDEVLAELEADPKRRIEWRRVPLPSVNCDPGLMRQVFANLIANALKYSRSRDPAIIEVGLQPSAGDPVVYIRDNGVGFDMRYADKLFGVFQRLHSSEDFEGNGVGLATVARIMRRHGGKIWAEAEVDKGATFYITLPAQPLAPLAREETRAA